MNPRISTHPDDEAGARLSEAVSRFEEAWRRGAPPSIDDFLPDPSTDSGPLLVELVHTDLEYRLKAGQAVRVEEYLKRYPVLVGSSLDLIAAEYDLRQRLDPDVGLDEYHGRFPDIFDALLARIGLPVIAGYTLLGMIGRGGMGVVYRATDDTLRRTVALKVIHPGRHADVEVLARFRAEAEAAARLQHPNIIQVFQVGEAGGLPYMALEYADGGGLDRLLGGRPVAPRSAAALVETLARAVQEAHDRGVIHRDLKPANVLWVGAGKGLPASTIEGPGLPKIADFGLAKLLNGESATTQAGQLLGTPSYMAPEQAEGRHDRVGPAADIHALGAILHEMLTGRPPFLGATPAETIEQVKSREPVLPSKLRPDLPRDLSTICLKCLAKDPTSRYDSALALADDLRRFLDGRPILARPPTSADRIAKLVRRNRVLVAGVAGVAVVATLGILLTERQRGRAVEAEARVEKQRPLNFERDAAEHRQRGDWPAVLRSIDAALAAGHPDPSRMHLDRAKALFALNRADDALGEIQAIERRDDLGPLAAEIQLIRGDLLLGVDNEEAVRLIRASLSGLTSTADQRFALGLLAETSPDALDHFQQALQAEPYHLRANEMAGLMLFFLGRKAEARRRLDIAEVFFPDDPNLHVLEALLLAADGDRAGAVALLDESRDQLGAKAITDVRPILDVLAELANIEDYVSVDGQVDLLHWGKIAGLILKIARAKGGDSDSRPGLRMGLPPVLARSYGKMAGGLGFAFTSAQVRSRKLDEAVEAHPEGMLHLIHAEALWDAGRLAESEAAFLQAADGPAIASISRLARFLAAVVAFEAADVHGKAPDLEAKARAVAHFRRLAASGGPPPKFLHLAANLCWQCGEFDLARGFVADWELQDPRNPDIHLMRSQIEYFDGNDTKAIKEAELVLARRPADGEAIQIRALATRRLQTAPRSSP